MPNVILLKLNMILGTSFIYLLYLPHPWVSGDGHEPQYPTSFWMERWTKSTCKPNRNSISKTKNHKLTVERRNLSELWLFSEVWSTSSVASPQCDFLTLVVNQCLKRRDNNDEQKDLRDQVKNAIKMEQKTTVDNTRDRSTYFYKIILHVWTHGCIWH